jgi:cytochrome b
MRAANLALRFLLELAALAGLAEGGDAAVGWGVAVLAVVAGALVWGLWCAPRARRRLPQPARTAVEAAVFGLGAGGYAAAGHTAIGVAFAVVAAANWALLFAFGDDP